jgi:hypothetical protein
MTAKDSEKSIIRVPWQDALSRATCRLGDGFARQRPCGDRFVMTAKDSEKSIIRVPWQNVHWSLLSMPLYAAAEKDSKPL